jgi:hypothetical protein
VKWREREGGGEGREPRAARACRRLPVPSVDRSGASLCAAVAVTCCRLAVAVAAAAVALADGLNREWIEMREGGVRGLLSLFPVAVRECVSA